MKQDDLPGRLAAHAALLAAIGRRGSFSAAAYELGLVQSAVSQRVKALEERLGYPLFTRTTRKVEPTPMGAIVCAAAERSMGEWSAVADQVRAFRNPASTGLSMSSALAMKWMIPSLPSLRAEVGDLLTRIDEDIADLNSPDVQVALRFGPGPYPGFHADMLCRCTLWPVASPNFAMDEPLDALIAKRASVLLQDRRAQTDGTRASWGDYATGRGLDWQDAGRADGFDRTDLALQAAIGSLGIALGRTLLVERDIEAGLLVTIGTPVPCRSRYWVVTTPAFATTKRYAALRDALRQEARLVRDKVQD
jgi:LysR family glycine cleavage system transcriptional activator